MNREIQDYITYNHMFRGADVLSMFVMDGILQNKEYAEMVLGDPAAVTTIFQQDSISLKVGGTAKTYANSYGKDILTLIDSTEHAGLAINGYLKAMGLPYRPTFQETLETGTVLIAMSRNLILDDHIKSHMPIMWKKIMDTSMTNPDTKKDVIESPEAVNALLSDENKLSYIWAQLRFVDDFKSNEIAAKSLANAPRAIKTLVENGTYTDLVKSKIFMDNLSTNKASMCAFCGNANALKYALSDPEARSSLAGSPHINSPEVYAAIVPAVSSRVFDKKWISYNVNSYNVVGRFVGSNWTCGVYPCNFDSKYAAECIFICEAMGVAPGQTGTHTTTIYHLQTLKEAGSKTTDVHINTTENNMNVGTEAKYICIGGVGYNPAKVDGYYAGHMYR